MMNYKTCTACKKEKEATLDNFHFHSRGKYRLREKCKECVNMANNEKYAAKKLADNPDWYPNCIRNRPKIGPYRRKETNSKPGKRYCFRCAHCQRTMWTLYKKKEWCNHPLCQQDRHLALNEKAKLRQRAIRAGEYTPTPYIVREYDCWKCGKKTQNRSKMCDKCKQDVEISGEYEQLIYF